MADVTTPLETRVEQWDEQYDQEEPQLPNRYEDEEEEGQEGGGYNGEDDADEGEDIGITHHTSNPPTATTPVTKPIPPQAIPFSRLAPMFPFASAQPKAESKPSPSGKTEAPEDRPSDPAELAEWYKNK